MRSRFLSGGAIAAIALLLTFAGQVHAQAFPAKSVRIVTYFSAGSGPDVLIRVIADQLSKVWSQAVVVENKPGANGIIAIDALAKSEPDGYTLGVTDSAVLTVNPHMYPSNMRQRSNPSFKRTRAGVRALTERPWARRLT